MLGQGDDFVKHPERVMLLTSSLEHGGAERQAVELARHLDRDRFDPFICSLSRNVPLADRLPDRSRDLVIVEKRWKFDATTVARVARLLSRERVSIVHAFLFDAEITGRLAARLARVPVMIGSERNSDHGRPRIHSVLLRATRGLCSAVIANSNAGKRFAIKDMGFASEKVHVVYNGVDIEVFRRRDAGEVRERYGVDAGAPVIGMVASFKPQKNHPMFLQMARRVRDRFPEARFLLVGGQLADSTGRVFSLKPGAGFHGDVGAYTLEVGGLMDELDLRRSCVLAGRTHEMSNVYSACDVVVLTSRHEGTPNVMLESMACGVPVVATDVADNAYVIPEGKVGYVVALDDADAMAARVCELLEDSARRAAMGRAARSWVEQEFTTKSLARNTEAVYSALLGEGAAGHRSEKRPFASVST